jgi:ferrous iron transport protein B
VALVGPPNSGKSTLFNRLTGLRQRVANYPGVTVERRTGVVTLVDGREIGLIDLPGVYSLDPRSGDERVARSVLDGTMPGEERPDAIILILDSTNLERHLMLAAPVLSLGLPTLLALNMADVLGSGGGELDTRALSEELDAHVALISAARGDGVSAVFTFLGRWLDEEGRGNGRVGTTGGGGVELPVIPNLPERRRWAAWVGEQAKYRRPSPSPWGRRLDRILLHPVGGPIIFFAVVIAVFQSIFTVAQPLMDGVEGMVVATGGWIGSALPASWLRSLLIDGVWMGVGSVLVFLPQILILFLFIGILEDSGYMARAAIIADRGMRRVGLQGKSFLPLMSSYACAVPSILAARTIESERDRIATILIAPLMTCSARLPVYALLIAAFIHERPLLGPVLGTRAAVMLGLYGLGLLAAIGTAALLKSTVLRSGPTLFALELPPYRWPTMQSLGLRLYDRAKIFLRRAGTIILTVAVLLWVLTRIPPGPDGAAPPIEHSVVGTIGKVMEPAIEPLGFNWKVGIGLVTSLAAREVIVGTLGTIYGVEAEDENSPELQEALRQDLTLGGAVGLLIFFVFALQCISTLAVVRRETGGWKWPILQFTYMLVLAYVGAFAANALL